MSRRYRHRVSTRRLPKQFRTLPIPGHSDYGDGLDDGKYYRCGNPNCGFICNIERDELGDSETMDGTTAMDYAFASLGSLDLGLNDPRCNMATLGNDIPPSHVCLENDAAGDPKSIPHSYAANTTGSGCPLCHTKNWRGDF